MSNFEVATTCPYCLRENEFHAGMEEDSVPTPGDYSICWGCSRIGEYKQTPEGLVIMPISDYEQAKAALTGQISAMLSLARGFVDVEDAVAAWRAGKTPTEEWVETATGEKLRVHHRDVCEEPPCPIHSPREHMMAGWPMLWRDGRGIMERLCPHGIGHPDPDDRRIRHHIDSGVHSCDGCCFGVDS